MLRLKLIFPVFLFFILSLSVIESAPAARPEEPLSMAMEAAGAQVEEFSVHSWVKLPNGQLTDVQLENMVQEVMSQLGVNPEEYQLIYQQKNQHRIVQAEVLSKSKSFHALVSGQVIPEGIKTGELQGYLFVTIEAKTKGISSISGMQEEIAHITNNFGPAPQISTCLIGWLDGKLRTGEWHKALSNAFRVIDGMMIDKLEAEHFVSYTGFTPRIANWLQVDGEKINLNMAMRYSEYDNRTYITIGSPIITREY